MERRIRPDQIRVGMYILGFDGAWINHPFWRRRFLVSSAEHVSRIRDADIDAVLIDDALGVAPLDTGMPAANPPKASAPLSARPSRRTPPAVVPPRDEHDAALQLMARSKKVMKHVFDGARLGRGIDTPAVAAAVEEISASVLRNPHALIGVTRLKSKHEYTYLHSVAVCALMINLARELGLPEARVRDLGLAGLLHDIGKTGVSEAVLDKPGGLDDLEWAEVRGHPEHGHRLLLQGQDVPVDALDVCLHHHEKMDGTGYPEGLAGDAITLAARMGAICDVYDALTSNRAYKRAWTPAEAVGAMMEWEGQFDRDLLFRFMQSILVFPAGLLVRLRSNRLGVVLAPKRAATFPRVRVFYATREGGMLEPTDVTISTSFADDQIVAVEQPDAWGLLGWDGLRDDLLRRRAA